MPSTHLHPMDHATQTANEWLRSVAAQFETGDARFVYRITRAWLHAVRDRLPVVEAAHLGAQLPELLRGTFYEGWNPAAVPVDGDVDAFVRRFADEAGVSRQDVPKILWAVSTAFDERLSNWPKILQLLPADLRALLTP